MQINSYGPSQPNGEPSRIPRAQERAAKQSAEKRRGAAQARGRKSNTRTRARQVSGRHKKTEKNGREWGGARNRKYRETAELKQAHAEGILQAIAVAELKGLPLNRFWTVNYEWAGIDDSEAMAFIGKLLAQCGRFARARGGAFAAVWVREIGAVNGAHVHIALHFPLSWKLIGALIRNWIRQAGGKYVRKVSKMEPIGGSLVCARTNPALYWANAEVVANYMVKGSGEAVADELGLSVRKYGGRIVGKRWGRTQNLG